jgi:uncharacterized protein YoxC
MKLNIIHALTLCVAGATLVIVTITRNQIMATFDDLKNQLTGVQSDLDDINSDVDKLLSIVNNPATPEGGLSADQVTEVAALLTSVKDRTSSTAAKYDSSTPPVEPPVV